MIDREVYKDYLLSVLPYAKLASNNNEIVCRCFYCDDHSRHLYISIPNDNNELSYYNCFRCPAKGIMTDKTLQEWNIYDDNIAKMLIDHNRNIKIHHKYINNNSIIYNTRIGNYISNIDIANTKLSYINNRLGISLSARDCIDLKIVLCIRDLLYINNINTYTRNISIIDEFNTSFIGFLSLDNRYINLRRIIDEGILYEGIDKRYINYDIYNANNIGYKFYIIPTTINLLLPYRIKLHIAEGPFDILSIYLNLRHKEYGIYASCNGMDYIGIFKQIILYIKTTYIELHIYPDNGNGGEEFKLRDIKSICIHMNIPLYIHRNIYNNEKDMGVPINRIKEKIYMI